MGELRNIKNYDDFYSNVIIESFHDAGANKINRKFIEHGPFTLSDGTVINPKDIVSVVRKAIVENIEFNFPYLVRFVQDVNIIFCIKKSDCETMAVDRHLNMFMNIEFIYKTLQMNPDYVAAIILHEVFHVIYNHLERGSRWLASKGMKETPKNHHDTNLAADIEVNKTLVKRSIISDSELKNVLHGLYLDEIGDNVPTMEYVLENQRMMDELRAMAPYNGPDDSNNKNKKGGDNASDDDADHIDTTEEFDKAYAEMMNKIADMLEKYKPEDVIKKLREVGAIEGGANPRVAKDINFDEVFAMSFIQIKSFDEFINEGNAVDNKGYATKEDGYNKALECAIEAIKASLYGGSAGVSTGEDQPNINHHINGLKPLNLPLQSFGVGQEGKSGNSLPILTNSDNNNDDDNGNHKSGQNNGGSDSQSKGQEKGSKSGNNNGNNDNNQIVEPGGEEKKAIKDRIKGMSGGNGIDDDTKIGIQGDNIGNSEGDSKNGSEGDSKNGSEGDSKNGSEGDSKNGSEGDSKLNSSIGEFIDEAKSAKIVNSLKDIYGEDGLEEIKKRIKEGASKNSDAALAKKREILYNSLGDGEIIKITMRKAKAVEKEYMALWKKYLHKSLSKATRYAGTGEISDEIRWMNPRTMPIGAVTINLQETAQDIQDINVYIDVSGSVYSNMKLMELMARALVTFAKGFEYSGINIIPWASKSTGAHRVLSLSSSGKEKAEKEILGYISEGAGQCGGGTDFFGACLPEIVTNTFQYKKRSPEKMDDVSVIITDGEFNKKDIESVIHNTIVGTETGNASVAKKIVKNCLWMIYDNFDDSWNDEIQKGMLVRISSKNINPE